MNQALAVQKCSERKQAGAAVVEFLVAFPVFLLLSLGTIQGGLLFHAKSNLNYAVYEAARAASVDHASIQSITEAFQRALVPYYGGGRSAAELAVTSNKVTQDWNNMPARIEILSPTKESFDDYAMAALQNKYGTSARVIPNSIAPDGGCPPSKMLNECTDPNPTSNASGQTLADANLLKLRVTYGVPRQKLVPYVGRIFVLGLRALGGGIDDPVKQAMLDQGRIPLVAHITLRMQSDAFENRLMESIRGSGNPVRPETGSSGPYPGTEPATEPEAGTGTPPTANDGQSNCPAWDPNCSTCSPGTPNCGADICSGG